jgi:hypothetical protein
MALAISNGGLAPAKFFTPKPNVLGRGLEMRGRAQRARLIGSVVVLVGILLLAGSLFLGWWYIYDAYGSGVTVYYGFPGTYGGIHYSSPNAVYSYSDFHLAHTATLYTEIQYVVILAFFVGAGGGFLGFWWRDRKGIVGPLVVIVAALIALAAPVALALAQPGAIQGDHEFNSAYGGTVTPWNSFWGASTLPGRQGVSWGPSVGWYLVIACGALFIVGAILLLNSWRLDYMSVVESEKSSHKQGPGPSGANATTQTPPT